MTITETINGETITYIATAQDILAVAVGIVFSAILIKMLVMLFINYHRDLKEQEQKLREIGVPIPCRVTDERRARMESGRGHEYNVTLEPIHQKDLKKYGTFTGKVYYGTMLFGMIPLGEKYLGKITTVIVNPSDLTEYLVEQERTQ